jgi:hypothetical protein
VVDQGIAAEFLLGCDVEETFLASVVSPCLGANAGKQIHRFREQIFCGQAHLPDGASVAELRKQTNRGQSDFFASSGEEMLVLQMFEVGGAVACNQVSLRRCRLRHGEVPETRAPTVGQIELVEIKVSIGNPTARRSLEQLQELSGDAYSKSRRDLGPASVDTSEWRLDRSLNEPPDTPRPTQNPVGLC